MVREPQEHLVMRKTAEFQHLVGLRMVVKGGLVNHVLGCSSLTQVKSTYNRLMRGKKRWRRWRHLLELVRTLTVRWGTFQTQCCSFALTLDYLQLLHIVILEDRRSHRLWVQGAPEPLPGTVVPSSHCTSVDFLVGLEVHEPGRPAGPVCS